MPNEGKNEYFFVSICFLATHFESRMIHLEQYRMRKVIQDNYDPDRKRGMVPIRNCPLHSLNHNQVFFTKLFLTNSQNFTPTHLNMSHPSSFSISSIFISVWYHSIISIAIRTQPAIVCRPSRSGQPPSTVATARFPLLATPMAKATRCWHPTSTTHVHIFTSISPVNLPIARTERNYSSKTGICKAQPICDTLCHYIACIT